MRLKQMNLAAIFTLTTALVIGGCKSSTPAAPATDSAAQSAPAAPPPAAPGAQPAATSTAPAMAPAPAPAATPAPVATSPAASVAPSTEVAAAPAPPAVRKLTAPSGATVSVTITQQLSAKNNNVGDGFSGELAAPVTTAGGATVFPRGAHVIGTVVAAKGKGKFKGSGNLAIQVTEISGHPVSVSSYEKEEKGKGKRTAGMIGGGAGGGALIGGLAGGGKGALIGGLVGAGAGTAGAALTGNKDIVIPAESVINFHLTAPVTITK
jgi:hypothetical protein